MKHPDWHEVMRNAGGALKSDNELVKVTRGSLLLVLPMLRKSNSEDYYHNYGAAEEEIREALGVVYLPPKTGGD